MTLNARAIRETREAANGILRFAQHLAGVSLHPYQLEAAEAVVRSVFQRDGMSFVFVFCRQAGKDEVLAIIFLFLMARFIEWGTEIVCAQPTFKPQTINAMERLMKLGAPFGYRLARSAGYILRLGGARTIYFSAEKTANQVGATADRLMVMNEAQDIDPSVYDKRFAPMTASGNATKIFSGTSWISTTLLGREMRIAMEAEKRDGVKRVFRVDCEEVGKVNRRYLNTVEEQVLKLGRNHPFIRTQFFCEEIDAQCGTFNAGRRALMQGDEPSQEMPPSFEVPANGESRRGGRTYAFLLDVAGQDEARMSISEEAPLANPGRDSVSLSIASIDLSTMRVLKAPTYRIVNRLQWSGQNHLVIFGKIKSLVESWKPQYIVIDATGVGEGLWAILDNAFPGQVIPVKFNAKVKSELGWKFLAIIESGRLRDCCPSEAVRLQYEACQSEVLPGPGKILRWGVPEGKRRPDGELIHDDYLMADALAAELDRLQWSANTFVEVIEGFDPFEEIK
jgi:hypothetical protein